MKKIIKAICFGMVLLLISFESIAQNNDSITKSSLYHLCKVWGFAKYFHPAIANGDVNWDEQLLNAIEGITSNSQTNSDFNQILVQMLDQAGEIPSPVGIRPAVPDSLRYNLDLDWFNDTILDEQLREQLIALDTSFRRRSHYLVGEAFSGGNPTHSNDTMYNGSQNYLSESMKYHALFKYWNIINYFYPYKNLMDINWDTTLIEFIDKFDSVEDDLSYNLVFKQLTSRLNDSHAGLSSPAYWDWEGDSYPPFRVRFIENETVITKVLPSASDLKPGDVLKEIDGHDIYILRDSLRKYAHGSNDIVIERNLNDLIMSGSMGSSQLTIDTGEGMVSSSFSRNTNNLSQLNARDNSSIWEDSILNTGMRVGMVNMGRLYPGIVADMFADFQDNHAIIFDIRDSPNATIWEIVNYIYPDQIHIASFTVPDITFPGTLFWYEAMIGSGTPNPYNGQIIILFDERTQSQAEYTVMGLEQFPGSVKIGSTTAAADGNVSSIDLPGGITTWYTGAGTFYPDYTETQRVGIIPDMEVLPTIGGVRAGRDEVMDAAFEWLSNRAYLSETDLPGYHMPGEQIQLEVHLHTPNDHSYDLAGVIYHDKSLEVIDSVGFSAASSSLYSGTFQIPKTEDHFAVNFLSRDMENGYVQEFHGVYRFTSKGPVVIDHYDIKSTDTIPNPGDRIELTVFLKNQGSYSGLSDIRADLTTIDPFIRINGSLKVDSLQAGEIKVNSSKMRIDIQHDCPAPSTQAVRLDFYENDRLYWTDTLFLEVFEELATLIETKEYGPKLYQNYPNPFAQKTTIDYALSEESQVKITIYDLTGREINTLVNKKQIAGHHSISFDASHLESGIYIYELKTGKSTHSNRMILSRKN